MENEINKLIREVLERFGIVTDQVIGEWNLIGHLVNIVDPLEKRIRELEAELERERRLFELEKLTHQHDLEGNSCLRECLKRLEWLRPIAHETAIGGYCPVCLKSALRGHAPDCWLAAEIAREGLK